MTLKSTVFDGLDERELEYVLARVNARSNAEAMRMAGLSKGWLRIKDADDLNARAASIRMNKALKATMKLEGFLMDAVEVKGLGLKSCDERVRQSVATEIIERFLGKPLSFVDIDTKEDNSKQRHEELMTALKDWQDAH